MISLAWFRSSIASYKKMKKRRWTSEEDDSLRKHVDKNGEKSWHLLRRNSILERSAKSCRERWLNNLKPDLKKNAFAAEEEELLIRLQKEKGNKWAWMAKKHFPGRTDNFLKNCWNKCMRRRQKGVAIHPEVDATHQDCRQEVDALRNMAEDFYNPLQIDLGAIHQDCRQEVGALRNMDEDFYNRLQIDLGAIHQDCQQEDGALPNMDEDFHNRLQTDLGAIADDLSEFFEADEQALPNTSTFQDPSLDCFDISSFTNLILTEADHLSIAVAEEEHIPAVQLDVSMLNEAAVTHSEQSFCKERKMDLSEAIDYAHHFERESLNTKSLPENPAAIIESNESLGNSEAAAADADHLWSSYTPSNEFPQQSWFQQSWNESLIPAWDFGMDWDLPSVLNLNFDVQCDV